MPQDSFQTAQSSLGQGNPDTAFVALLATCTTTGASDLRIFVKFDGSVFFWFDGIKTALQSRGGMPSPVPVTYKKTMTQLLQVYGTWACTESLREKPRGLITCDAFYLSKFLFKHDPVHFSSVLYQSLYANPRIVLV